jgi:hypothetical protein
VITFVEEKVVSMWRMYRDKTPEQIAEHAQFQGVCTIFFMQPEVVYVKGLLADMDRETQRAFLDFCIAHGIERVKAEREPGRSLPLARRTGEGRLTETLVADLVERFKRGGGPAPVGPHRRATDQPEPPP